MIGISPWNSGPTLDDQHQSVLENVRDHLRGRTNSRAPSDQSAIDKTPLPLRVESHVYDVGHVAGILVHMGSSDFDVGLGEIGWMGVQLRGHAQALAESYEEIWRLRGGST
jgi:hypothetical protein